jgi:integrase
VAALRRRGPRREAIDADRLSLAAFTGLRRGELVALRWRDVDFERSSIRASGSYTNGKLTTPKSGHGRVVPMVPEVAEALARLGQRGFSTGDDELVFRGDFGTYLDGSALRRRFVAACARAHLRPIRFHDLRHTFGTLAVRGAESIVELQNWLGHAEVRTTMRYTHYREQQGAAARLAAAFKASPAQPAVDAAAEPSAHEPAGDG